MSVTVCWDSGLPGPGTSQGGRKGKECEHDWAGPVGDTAGLMSPIDEEQWSPGSRGWTAVEEWPESPSVCVCVCVHYHEEQGVTPCFCELQRWLKGGWVEQRCELS